MMSVKDMKRSDWHRCLKKEYVARDCRIGGIEGKENLTVLKELTGPLTVHYDYGDVLIADAGYAWLQIALRDRYAWLTAMYDASGQLIQLYFDITKGNCFDDPENPYFTDMYLDIVVTAAGEIHVVDQEDLDRALEKGAITREEYNHAEEVCRKLYDYLVENKSAVIDYCNRVFGELKGAIRE